MLRFLFNFISFLLVAILVVVTGVSLYLFPQLPDTGSLQDIKLQEPLRIYSQDNSLIAEFGEKKRQPITIDNIPQTMIQAFLAAEDDRFYQHPGVDWQGIARASLNLVSTGQKTQGGSTITMQVARNFFLSRERTFSRKFNEILLALKIEQELTKEKILELYLNKIYFGHHSYGVAAAAKTYYGATPNELTLAQTAMLAALPKAPSSTNPLSNAKQAKNRRNYVLQRMLEENFITEQAYSMAINSPITATLHGTKVGLEAPYVAEMVRRQLVEQYGNSVYTDGLKVKTTIKDKNQNAGNRALRKALFEYDTRHGYRGPEHRYDLTDNNNKAIWQRLLKDFRVVGDLHPALVVKINALDIKAYLPEFGLIDIDWQGLSWARPYLSENRRGKKPESATDFLRIGDVIRVNKDNQERWRLSQIPEVQGALVSMNPNNGGALALVGGLDFKYSKFNRATQARRQPGSGFKPFIYSAGLAAGNTAATIINDAPITLQEDSLNIWQPENYNKKNYGPTRLREALIKSRNLVSIRLLKEIGVPFALKHIEKFGFNISKFPQNLSLSLGSISTTPWQMANAYCVFANGGYMVESHLIETIWDNNQQIIYQANPPSVCHACLAEEDTVEEISDPEVEPQPANGPSLARRVVDERNIWIMNSITQDVIKYGTGRKALTLNRKDLSGKTGTTNNQRDTWFYGYNVDTVAVSWVGFDNFRPLGNKETGASAALPMWIEYMRIVLDGEPEVIPNKPPGLIHLRINKKTGLLADAGGTDTMFEVFRTQYAPTMSDGTLTDPEITELF